MNLLSNEACARTADTLLLNEDTSLLLLLLLVVIFLYALAAAVHTGVHLCVLYLVRRTSMIFIQLFEPAVYCLRSCSSEQNDRGEGQL